MLSLETRNSNLFNAVLKSRSMPKDLQPDCPPKELESDLINVQFSIPNSHLRNIHTNAFCSDENWELRIEH
jgi:hypothetical protein